MRLMERAEGALREGPVTVSFQKIYHYYYDYLFCSNICFAGRDLPLQAIFPCIRDFPA